MFHVTVLALIRQQPIGALMQVGYKQYLNIFKRLRVTRNLLCFNMFI
jgi:hypothetical protein